jgi:ATP-binding cassette, subfamily C, bacterial
MKIYNLDLSSKEDMQGLRLVRFLFSGAPWLNVFIITGLMISGLLEAVGIAAILPLFASFQAQTEKGKTVGGSGGETEVSQLQEVIYTAVDLLGIKPSIASFLVLIVVIFWLKSLFTFAVSVFTSITAARFVTSLRLEFIRSVLFARWSYFSELSTGLLTNAMTVEATRVSAAYLSMISLMSLGFQIAMFLGFAVLFSWQITVAAVVSGALLLAGLNTFVKMTRKSSATEQRAFDALSDGLVNSLINAKPLKAMAAENLVLPFLEDQARFLFKALKVQFLAGSAIRHVSEPLVTTFLAVGLLIVSRSYSSDLAELIVVGLLFHRIVTRTSNLQLVYQTFVRHEKFVAAFFKKLGHATESIESLHGGTSVELQSGIEVNNVSFSYADVPVLKNVSIRIPAGKVTLVTGPSGSGKTTLVDLIVGFHNPSSGDITINGVPLTDVDMRKWRGGIGYVPQELVLFDGSIRDNVTLKDPDVSEEILIDALKTSGAWGFVSSLPGGVDTPVGERGMQMSGGQRQRISIARALARTPDLLVLDEPTTALDPKTEAEICETLNSLKQNMTILAISHQPAIAKVADNVIHMQPLVHEEEPSLAI